MYYTLKPNEQVRELTLKELRPGLKVLEHLKDNEYTEFIITDIKNNTIYLQTLEGKMNLYHYSLKHFNWLYVLDEQLTLL